MNVPMRGSMLWQLAEVNVRVRQAGRALSQEVPVLGIVGNRIAGLWFIRDLYPSEKTVRRSDEMFRRPTPPHET